MRKRRDLQAGAIYHVASKIDHGDMALEDAVIKQLFLDMVVLAKKKFPFKIWNFTVMGNHIHFLIQPGEGVSLSKLMQWLKCNFAKKWNKMHGRHGHVWGERFFSKIVQDRRAFENVSTYIDENPLKAGLVEKAVDWVFGGLSHRLRGIRWLLDELWETGFYGPPVVTTS
ncbi:MAG: transposase [Treponema sp.]|jgi:putative transposase|nr:transposase [Treponema sp.]